MSISPRNFIFHSDQCKLTDTNRRTIKSRIPFRHSEFLNLLTFLKNITIWIL